MMEILQSFGVPIVMVGFAIAAFSAFLVYARNYRKCPPNQALVVYGRKRKETDKDGKSVERGFRLITGGSAFVIPLLEGYQDISFETLSIDAVVLDTPNADGVAVSVEATANVKVSSNPAFLPLAVERIMDKSQEEKRQMLKTTLEGLLRQIIGTLTVENIIKDRERLALQVLQGAQAELNKLGFEIDVFVVNKISDKGGYIDALGAKRTAEVKRDAAVAQAEATREQHVKSSAAKQIGETAKLQADEQIAKATRDLALKTAEFRKETETADAEAEMAKALKVAEIDKDLRRRRVEAEAAETTAKIELARENATCRQAELVAEKIKPAEATKEALIIEAEGKAKAAASNAEATKAIAEAEKVRLIAEGEGRAAAEAASKRQLGLAEAEAIGARLSAEADGLLKKNKALDEMGDGAKTIIILERLPQIIEEIGEAGERIVASAFEHVGAGLARIDSVHIVDFGNSGNGHANGNGSSAIANFATSIPEIVFKTMAKAKAAGFDVEGITKALGLSEGALTGLLGNLRLGPTNPTSSEEEVTTHTPSTSHEPKTTRSRTVREIPPTA